MGMSQRPPQKLPDPKEMKKQTLEQYNKATNMLIQSLDKAKIALKNRNYGSYDATAVVNLALILFQLEMAKEQGLAKVKQLEEYLKNVKKAQRPQ